MSAGPNKYPLDASLVHWRPAGHVQQDETTQREPICDPLQVPARGPIPCRRSLPQPGCFVEPPRGPGFMFRPVSVTFFRPEASRTCGHLRPRGALGATGPHVGATWSRIAYFEVQGPLVGFLAFQVSENISAGTRLFGNIFL